MSAGFDRWTSLGALWAAALRAARGKRHRASVARVLLELESEVLRLHDKLRAGTWQPGSMSTHRITDPQPRLIGVTPFTDRIVHQALCAEVGPVLDRGLIADTFACRPGLGTHAALRRAVAWARSYRDDRARLTDRAHALEDACLRQRLRLHPWEVRPTSSGVTFVGFRILPDHVRVRRPTVSRARRRLNEFIDKASGTSISALPSEALIASLRSTLAHWDHADTWRLRRQVLRELGLCPDPDDEPSPEEGQREME